MFKSIGGACVLAILCVGNCGSGADLPKLRTGTTIGVVQTVSLAKNKRDWEAFVWAPGEEKARKYTVGAHQKELLERVKSLVKGDRVEIHWFDTVEGLCIEKLQVLKNATPDKKE